MQLSLEDLLSKLRVTGQLAPYESQMWVADSEDGSESCTAEVRVTATGDTVEAEIVRLTEELANSEEFIPPFFQLKASQINSMKFEINVFTLGGSDWSQKIPNWEQKACNFFMACAAFLEAGQIPDFEELIRTKIDSEDGHIGGGGGGGGVKPGIDLKELLKPYNKKPPGMF